MTKDLTRGTPWKLILQFALPIMAGNLLQQLYNTADTIIVGNFNGQQALSAVGACASLTVLFTALAIGFSIGAGVLISQYFGASRERELRQYAATAIVLMLAMGLFMSLAGVVSARFLLERALGTPEALLPMPLQLAASLSPDASVLGWRRSVHRGRPAPVRWPVPRPCRRECRSRRCGCQSRARHTRGPADCRRHRRAVHHPGGWQATAASTAKAGQGSGNYLPQALGLRLARSRGAGFYVMLRQARIFNLVLLWHMGHIIHSVFILNAPIPANHLQLYHMRINFACVHQFFRRSLFGNKAV
mgnify:CR=1 FL=1